MNDDVWSSLKAIMSPMIKVWEIVTGQNIVVAII